jgi:hypothetical protein
MVVVVVVVVILNISLYAYHHVESWYFPSLIDILKQTVFLSLYCLSCCSLIPFTQMLGLCVKLGLSHFLPHPCQYIIHQSLYCLILYNLNRSILRQIYAYEFVTLVNTADCWCLGLFDFLWSSVSVHMFWPLLWLILMHQDGTTSHVVLMHQDGTTYLTRFWFIGIRPCLTNQPPPLCRSVSAHLLKTLHTPMWTKQETSFTVCTVHWFVLGNGDSGNRMVTTMCGRNKKLIHTILLETQCKKIMEETERLMSQ